MAITMKKKKIEQRSKQRIPIAERVQIVCENMDNFIMEYADNISIGGMFIKTKTPFPNGTRFNLELTISQTGQKIQGIGEVVWTKESSSSDSKVSSGMGIKFLELKGNSRAVIIDLVEKSGS
jgi:molecular chaperone DnaK